MPAGQTFRSTMFLRATTSSLSLFRIAIVPRSSLPTSSVKISHVQGDASECLRVVHFAIPLLRCSCSAYDCPPMRTCEVEVARCLSPLSTKRGGTERAGTRRRQLAGTLTVDAQGVKSLPFTLHQMRNYHHKMDYSINIFISLSCLHFQDTCRFVYISPERLCSF